MQTRIIHLDSSIIQRLIDGCSDVDCVGKYWRSEEFLSKIFFSEIIDIVLLYILKSPDYCLLEEIKTKDFAQALGSALIKWNPLRKKGAWLKNVGVPWASSPGPGDGYASDLEYYCMHFPGFLRFNKINDFYDAQKGWKEYYREQVIKITLPK